jgi:serralysin
MQGGPGDDSYEVDDSKDQVIETTLVGGSIDAGGIDTVRSSESFTLSRFVENLVLTGSHAIDGTGNELANLMTGNEAANVLQGGAGDDTLDGGLANDTLTGGDGADRFVFDTALHSKKNLDRIADFDPAADTIVLSRAVFASFTSNGEISAANLVIGSAATLPDQYLLYDKPKGVLLYDADGSGPELPVRFAVLTGLPTLDATDFIVSG